MYHQVSRERAGSTFLSLHNRRCTLISKRNEHTSAKERVQGNEISQISLFFVYSQIHIKDSAFVKKERKNLVLNYSSLLKQRR